ncbi:MAG: 4Fe-4S binding protein [Luteimonas sp.]|nr:4Fe-4S binding protein [Luteimonas sp.]
MSERRIPLDVVDELGNSYYVKERKVYPRDVAGTFNRLRVAAVFWLLGMFYVFPWLRWDGRQAVLFDLPARKFHVFGLTFWPQDFLFLALLLIIAAMALFFFTALAGRLFCGYACPQTVWTEVFLWMERWTEGDRAKRIKLDASPWNRDKILRKCAKHVLWALFALWQPASPSWASSPRSPISPLACSRFHGADGRRSGPCSTRLPHGATPASCASRCASTCVPMHASRARCSIATRSSLPTIRCAANRAARASAA